jgi:hypothetical protein
VGFKRKLPKAEKEARDKMLADARGAATTEKRGGRKFRVLHLPDQYGTDGPPGGKWNQDSALDALPGDGA